MNEVCDLVWNRFRIKVMEEAPLIGLLMRCCRQSTTAVNLDVRQKPSFCKDYLNICGFCEIVNSVKLFHKHSVA